ncbi:MAG: lysostaphin resistance A-like protein [Tepidisphaeraceae bacterium]
MTQLEQAPPSQAGSSFLRVFISWTLILTTAGYVVTRVILAQSGAARTRADDVTMKLLGRYCVGAVHVFDQGKRDGKMSSSLVPQVQQAAKSDTDRARAAMVIGEVAPVDRAVAQLDLVRAVDDSPLADDVLQLRRLYSAGAAALGPEQRQSLIDHHGWFARLALTRDARANDPERRAVLAAATRTFVGFVSFIGVFIVLALAGLVLFISAIVQRLRGRLVLNYRPPIPPETALLEAFAIYIVSFEVLVRTIEAVGRVFAANWLLTLCPALGLLWLRRQLGSWTTVSRALGWNSGRGVLREAGAGFVGYVAGIPVVVLGFFISVRLSRFAGVTPTHPIMEGIGRGGAMLAMIYLLACVWAPVIEETMFRGALFGHLRARWGWLISACVTGLIFAAIHPQGWTLIPTLGAIGIVLAAIREWRGSLVGPMVAHGLNNFIVFSLAVFLLG